MDGNAKALVERVKVDSAFRAALSALPDKESRMAMAAVEGYAFTADELERQLDTFFDDDLNEVIFQESALGYDSELGHGWTPEEPNPPRGPDEPSPPKDPDEPSSP